MLLGTFRSCRWKWNRWLDLWKFWYYLLCQQLHILSVCVSDTVDVLMQCFEGVWVLWLLCICLFARLSTWDFPIVVLSLGLGSSSESFCIALLGKYTNPFQPKCRQHWGKDTAARSLSFNHPSLGWNEDLFLFVKTYKSMFVQLSTLTLTACSDICIDHCVIQLPQFQGYF